MSDSSIHISEDEQHAKCCAFCQNAIEAGETAVSCRRCGTAHHRRCWKENGGCATLGCMGRAYRNVNMPQPDLVESVQILTDMGVDTSLDVLIGDLLAEPWTHQVEMLEPDIRVNEENLGHRPVIVLDEVDLRLTLVQPQLRDVAELFCAYCHNPIETGAPAVACRTCGTPYHEDCWNASRRCAALGCESKRSVFYQPAPRTEQGLMSAIPIVQPTEETLKEKILRFLRSLRG